MKQTTTAAQSRSLSTASGQTYATGLNITELQNTPLPEDFDSLTGELPFTMLNDALFHIVFEATPAALHSLICSMLSLQPEEITSIEVTNPIQIGNSVYTKDFILDLNIRLNNNCLINIELQVLNFAYWKERSLGYLCRTYDNLNKGSDYADTLPAIHIGILNFEVFPGDTEFYATYHLANDLSHKIYSDNFRLSVLQLRQLEHATETDKNTNRYLWAKFFNATTWEEIRMLSEQNPSIAEAVKTIYRVTEDESIRHLCESRREGIKTHNTLVNMNKRTAKALAKASAELKEAQEELQKKSTELAEKTNELAEKEARIASLSDLLMQQITKKVTAGKSLAQISDEVELPVEQIQELYDCIRTQIEKK